MFLAESEKGFETLAYINKQMNSVTDSYVEAEMRLLAVKRREIVNLEKLEETERDRDFCMERLRQVGKVSVHALQQTNLQLESSLLSRFADIVEHYAEFFARGAKVMSKLKEKVEPARRHVEIMKKQIAEMTTSGVDRIGQLHLLEQIQQVAEKEKDKEKVLQA